MDRLYWFLWKTRQRNGARASGEGYQKTLTFAAISWRWELVKAPLLFFLLLSFSNQSYLKSLSMFKYQKLMTKAMVIKINEDF